MGILSVAMPESLLTYVIDQLQDAKGDWPIVAKRTRISKRTIEKIAAGTIKDPGVRKIERLAEYFRANGHSDNRSELRA